MGKMEYEGEDNLEVMKLAENYNNFLVDDVASRIRSMDKVILDFGSGDGYYSKKISTKIEKEIICIEPAQNLKKYYKTQQVLDSLSELADSSVDFVYSLNVLEHIQDDRAIIDLIYAKLKSDGRVYFYLPAMMALYSSMDEKVGHYRRYSKADINRLFDKEQWKIEECCYADSLGVVVTLFFKWFGNKNGKLNPVSLKIYDKLIFPFSYLFDKITYGLVAGKNIQMMAIKK